VRAYFRISEVMGKVDRAVVAAATWIVDKSAPSAP